MNITQSVSNLNNQIKSLLETTFLHVSVEGEVSRITYHNSGHVYFTLKDENSSVSCVMFRGNNMKMKFRLEEGMAVILHGSISVYSPRGSYQVNCTTIEPAGAGALNLAYEQLKKKLQAKGYFDCKKPMPKEVLHVALVTSATSAALQDMLRIAQTRWPLVKITIIDTIVQGDASANMLAQNIKKADILGVDIIVIGRGGGSIEDLWGFNEEIVADAIYRAKTFIVSAVGHEIDYVISDFVSDLRAPTPSAAMEMILPDKSEMLMRIDNMIEQMNSYVRRIIHNKQDKLEYLKKLFISHSFEAKISINEKEIELLKNRYEQIMKNVIEHKNQQNENIKENLHFSMKKLLHVKENKLSSLNSNYLANNPQNGLKESFAQIVINGKRGSLKSLHVEDIFELHSPKEVVRAKVLNKI